MAEQLEAPRPGGIRRRLNVVGALQRNAVINAAVKKSRLDRLANAWLRRFPIRRRTPGGLVYTVDSVAALVVAREIFATEVYAVAVRTARPRTIVDLGSNVGYFPLLVADLTGSRDLKGLCVEANRDLHPIAARHLSENRLHDVHLVHGAVTGELGGAPIDLYVSPSHIASTVTGRFNPRVPAGGRIERVQVPVVDVEAMWRARFGADGVDLLKVDIEGSEVAFLRGHAAFLRRVKAALVEWHAWVTSLEQVAAHLAPAGLTLEFVCDEDANAGTAYFSRR